MEGTYILLGKYVFIAIFITLFSAPSLSTKHQSNGQTSPVSSHSIETIDIDVGDRPRGLGFNSDTNMLYVANQNSHSISVIDLSVSKVTANIPTEFSPANVFVNSNTNRIYVIYWDNAFIDIINGSTNKVDYRINSLGKEEEGSSLDEISLTSVSDLAINPNTNKIYAIYDSSTLAVIDGLTNNIMMIRNESNPILERLAVNPNTNKIYLFNNANLSISVIDEKKYTNEANISIGDVPDEIIVDSRRNKVYGTIGEGNRIFVIDGNSNKFVTSIITGYSRDPGSNDLVVDSSTGRIFMSNPNTQSISVIDPPNGIIDQLQLTGDPADLEINLKTHQIYVLREELDTVSIIDIPMTMDTPNEIETAGIQVGDEPMGIAVNPHTNKIYVANYISLTISVIDGTNNKRIDEIGTGGSSLISDIVFNPVDNKVYLAFLNGTIGVVHDSGNVKLLPINIEGYLSSLGFSHQYPSLLYLFGWSGGNYSLTAIDVPKNKTVYRMASDYLSEEGGEKVMGEETVFPIVTEQYGSNYTKYNITYNVVDGSFHELALTPNGIQSILSIPIMNDTLHDVALTDVNLQTNMAYITTANDTLAVVDPYIGKVVASIPVGKFPSAIEVNPQTNMIYVSSQNHTLSIIDGNSNKLITSIPVGKFPSAIEVNPQTNMIYVANSGSDKISVIDGSTNKVSSDITFHINPSKSGHIKCDNKEYPTNSYIRIPSGTECTAEANEGFSFVGWTQELGNNSTKTITSAGSDSPFASIIRSFGLMTEDGTHTLNVSQYGNFSANFKEVPPPIPPEYWIPLYGVIVSSIVGWSIPSIIGWFKTRRDMRRLHNYHRRISSLNDDGKLDKHDIESLDRLHKNIADDYAKGRLNNEHYSNLRSEISILYDGIFQKNIEALNYVSDKNFGGRKMLEEIEKSIMDAYSKGKILDLHYKLLKDSILKYKSI